LDTLSLAAPHESDEIGGLTDCEDGGNRWDTDAGAEFNSAQNKRREESQRDTSCHSGPSQTLLEA
jgi:hypothetical protein